MLFVVYLYQYNHLLSLKASAQLPSTWPASLISPPSAGNLLATNVIVLATLPPQYTTARDVLRPDKYHWWETGPALQYPLQHQSATNKERRTKPTRHSLGRKNPTPNLSNQVTPLKEITRRKPAKQERDPLPTIGWNPTPKQQR